MNKFEQQMSAMKCLQNEMKHTGQSFQGHQKQMGYHLVLSRFVKLQTKLVCNHEMAAADLLEQVINDFKAAQ